MSVIKTWSESCKSHPDHQTGMVSNKMIQARMQEEIDALRAALAEPEQQPEVQTETEYNIGFKAGWEKGWHYGSMVENSACARILDQNAQACANNSMLQDVLNGNAAAIRARSNTNDATR